MAHDLESHTALAGELKRRQALLRWRVYTGWPVILGVTFGGSYILIRTFGWAWWSVLLCFLLLAPTAPATRSLLPKWTLLAQQARGKWLLASAKTSDRPPILLLRSFSSAVTVEPTPTIAIFGEHPINEPTNPAAARSHLLRIARHVRAHGPVVAIGRAKRGIAMAPKVDVLMFEPSDAVWFRVFEILSDASRAVVLLPGETNSVACEYKSLKERDLITKLVIVMPPNGIFYGPWRVRLPLVDDNLDELQDGWERARSHFKSLDVSLPPYDPSGLAMTVGPDGQVKNSVALGGSFVRLKRAVERLVLPETIKAEPLGTAMARLEQLGLAGIESARIVS